MKTSSITRWLVHAGRVGAALACLHAAAATAQTPPWRDTKLTFEVRAADLFSRPVPGAPPPSARGSSSPPFEYRYFKGTPLFAFGHGLSMPDSGTRT